MKISLRFVEERDDKKRLYVCVWWTGINIRYTRLEGGITGIERFQDLQKKVTRKVKAGSDEIIRFAIAALHIKSVYLINIHFTMLK